MAQRDRLKLRRGEKGCHESASWLELRATMAFGGLRYFFGGTSRAVRSDVEREWGRLFGLQKRPNALHVFDLSKQSRCPEISEYHKSGPRLIPVKNTSLTFDGRTIADCNSLLDHSAENPVLFIRIHLNMDGTRREEYRWSFVVAPAKGEAISNGQKYCYWIGWHLEPFGDHCVCRFEARQNDLQENLLLVRLVIAEVKDLTRLDCLLSSRPSADATDHPNLRSLVWVKEQLGRLVGEGCLKGKPDSFKEIEKQGRELAQRSSQLGETIYVPSQSAWIDKEVGAVGKRKEAPPSSAGPSDKPTSSMGPPLLPASATRGKRNKLRDQAAGRKASAQGQKFFTMDDLPLWPQPKLG
ncbi:MAG: hypothetical protein Q9161_009642 [Pseudevernia consocians]